MIKNNSNLLKILSRVEWQGKTSDNTCPICNRTIEYGHADNCILFKYLNLSIKCKKIAHRWFKLIDKEEFIQLLYDLEQRALPSTDTYYCIFCGEICSCVDKITHTEECILNQLILEIEERYIGQCN